MKLLYSRALLAGSRTARQCRAQYTLRIPILPSCTPYPQRSSYRFYTTTTSITTPRKEPQNELSTTLPLPDQVRLLMRRVPYPVAIITSTEPALSARTTTPSTGSEPPSTQYRGMTVSSFNTVTLMPQPVISFNVRRPSETLHALLTSGRFLVHLLSPTRETAALARDFARGNQNLALGESGFEFVACTPSPPSSISGAGAGLGGEGEETSPALPLPMLRRRTTSAAAAVPGPVAESFPFVFECKLLPDNVVDVYDHTIVFGSVVRAIANSAPIADATITASPQDLCLTYADTRFWEVGKHI
ncbi:flavin reductase like domain-containing protein [Aspergillus pseudoustus]|uniref:Flavin reductase like domain-containing protein n=1 Tax=Aspergillus pseudoustus TaxID=1810923 RepID=A0ABR4K8H0_9EURO